MNKVIKLLKKEKLTIAGGLTGAAGGYLYWYFIGCNSGGCAITSTPLNSTLYGIVLGALIFSLFKKEGKKSEEGKSAES